MHKTGTQTRRAKITETHSYAQKCSRLRTMQKNEKREWSLPTMHSIVMKNFHDFFFILFANSSSLLMLLPVSFDVLLFLRFYSPFFFHFFSSSLCVIFFFVRSIGVRLALFWFHRVLLYFLLLCVSNVKHCVENLLSKFVDYLVAERGTARKENDAIHRISLNSFRLFATANQTVFQFEMSKLGKIRKRRSVIIFILYLFCESILGGL